MAFLIKLLLWSLAALALLLVPLLIFYLPDYGGFTVLNQPLSYEKTLWWYLDAATYALGHSLYFLPLATLAMAWRFTWHQDWRISQSVFLTSCMAWGYLFSQASLAGLFTLHLVPSHRLPASIDAGGAIGNIVAAYGLQLGFSLEATTLILLTIFLISISVMLWLPWLLVLEKLGQWLWLPLERKHDTDSEIDQDASTKIEAIQEDKEPLTPESLLKHTRQAR